MSFKKTSSILAVVLFLTFLTLLTIIWYHQNKISFKRYDAFGIAIPVDYTIHGIDVSRYQQYIGWEEIKAMNIENINIHFVFIKATEGEDDVDIYFKRNWKQAYKNKIVRGAYHYFIASRDAKKQALNFISNVTLLPGDLPPVLDIEHTNNIPTKILQAKAKVWLDIIEKHYHIKPVIYTNTGFYKKYLGDYFDEYPLWIAHYYEKHNPRIERAWTFWQHNDRGNVNGINTKVDFNVFNGDSIQFNALRKQ